MINVSNKMLNIILIIVFIVLTLMLGFHGINIDYKVDEQNLNISCFNGINIPLKEIEEVKILNDIPNMHKIMGIEIFNIRQGTYFLDGVGRILLYASDIRYKLVLVKTKNITYGLTPKNPIEFVKKIVNKKNMQTKVHDKFLLL